MNESEEFLPLVTASFDVDLAGMERSEAAVIDDRTIDLLRRENRIALRKGKTERITPPDAAAVLVVPRDDVPAPPLRAFGSWASIRGEARSGQSGITS